RAAKRPGQPQAEHAGRLHRLDQRRRYPASPVELPRTASISGLSRRAASIRLLALPCAVVAKVPCMTVLHLVRVVSAWTLMGECFGSCGRNFPDHTWS